MTDTDITTKVFFGRDSATAALRKIGVKSKDYNLFIEKKHDGKFACDLRRAREHLAAPVPVSQDAAATKKRTISSVARALIIEGKTNEEVWKLLVNEFNLSDNKRGYPAWYRSQCRSKGLIE